jgi:hypothetical protein
MVDVTHTTDSILLGILTRTHTSDSVLGETEPGFSKTHTTDSFFHKFEVVSLGESVVLATETGSDGTLTDFTACLTDGDNAVTCTTVIAGLGIKAVWPHAPTHISNMVIRLGVSNIPMGGNGTNRIAPYDSATTIDNTNGVTSPGNMSEGDNDIVIPQSLIDDCPLTFFTFRQFEDGDGGTTEMGEISIAATIETLSISGITKDDDDVIVDLMPLTLLERSGGSAPYTWTTLQTTTSAATTGAYTFEYEDFGSQMRVFGQNISGTESDITPEVLGV